MPVTLVGVVDVGATLVGVVDGFVEGAPIELPRLDFSRAANSMFLGAI